MEQTDMRSMGGPLVAAIHIESRTLRKIRTRILPFIFILYIIAFLDRINIGFAALTMNKDLGITSQQYGLLTGIFFPGYFIFEIPSNLWLHKFGARVWIARILISWGLVAVLTGFVQNTHQLYFMRFLLGVAEAGFFPGIVLYLTYWFPQRARAQAVAQFMTALPVASILGAPLSGLILDQVHWLGISSWRWLLILEGMPAAACGVLTYFLLPSRPAEADFLSVEEKSWIMAEITGEEQQRATRYRFSPIRVLGYGRVWHLVLIYFTLIVGSYSISFWMPQALKSLSAGYSNSLVGLLVMIPYATGLMAMIFVSRSSDRRMERRYHTAIPAIIAGTALLLLNKTSSPYSVLLLLAFAVSGIQSFYGPFWSQPSEFLTGFSAASGIALINSVANLGGFVGPYALGVISHKVGSLYAGLSLAGVSLFLSATLQLLLPKEAQRVVPTR